MTTPLTNQHVTELPEPLSAISVVTPLAVLPAQWPLPDSPPHAPPLTDDAKEREDSQSLYSEFSAEAEGRANICKDSQTFHSEFSAEAEGDANFCEDSQTFTNDLSDETDEDAKECNHLQTFESTTRDDKPPSISQDDLHDSLGKLSGRQISAIGMMLLGKRDVDIVDKLGIHVSTLWRWKQEAHFADALNEARTLAYGSAIDRVRDLIPQAVDALQKQLAAGDGLSAIRLLRLVRLDRDWPSAAE